MDFGTGTRTPVPLSLEGSGVALLVVNTGGPPGGTFETPVGKLSFSHALIGAAVFTFILFTRDLGRILELVVRNSAPLPSVAELFFFTMPTALTVTVKAQKGSLGTRWMLDHLHKGMRIRRATKRTKRFVFS